MKKLKSQSGRSMVEMLGVLAIIGVLSVGGIAGYSLGMRKHRANGLADVASKYALVAYNDCQQIQLKGEGTGICAQEEVIAFEDADVGKLPAGVKKIFNPAISLNEDDGMDHLNLSIEFDDDTLCKAYGSIIGTGCNSSMHTTNHTIKFN